MPSQGSFPLKHAFAFPFAHSLVKNIPTICDAPGTLPAPGPLVLVNRHASVVKGDRQVTPAQKVHSHKLEKETDPL